MSVSRLVLGTAGLGGLPYGRNGRTVSAEVARTIMRTAYERGIYQFDTSPAYGQAQEWLGQALRDCKAVVMSKGTGDPTEMGTTLKVLGGVEELYLLRHNWTPSAGPINDGESGSSVYGSADLHAAVAAGHQFAQVEWSLLRQTHMPLGATAIFLRSVLSQGVLAGAPLDTIPGVVRLQVERAQAHADGVGIPLREMALRSALGIGRARGVVIGPTSMEELEQCLQIAKKPPLTLPWSLNLGEIPETDPRTWASCAPSR